MLRSHGYWAAIALAYQWALTAEEPNWPTAVDLVPPSARSVTAARLDASLALNVESKPEATDHPQSLDLAVRRAPVCIVWDKVWAGELGASILYRVKQLNLEQIEVGYFVFWTTERPWGENEQTRWVLPALLIDAFYTRTLFVLPGIQRAMYGAGDIEGARVRYRLDGTQLKALSIVVEDTAHRETSIEPDEAVDPSGRVMLYSQVWSHQLAGRAALGAIKSGAKSRCYEGTALRPLTREVAAAFRLGSSNDPLRAKPAWRF